MGFFDIFERFLSSVTPMQRLARWGSVQVMDALILGPVPSVEEGWEAMTVGNATGMIRLSKVFVSYLDNPAGKRFFDDMPKNVLERATRMGIARHMLGEDAKRVVEECAGEPWFPEFLTQCTKDDERFLSSRDYLTITFGREHQAVTAAIAPQHLPQLCKLGRVHDGAQWLATNWKERSGRDFPKWMSGAGPFCSNPQELRAFGRVHGLVPAADGEEIWEDFRSTGKPPAEYDAWVFSQNLSDELIRQADAAAEKRGWVSLAADVIEPLSLPNDFTCQAAGCRTR